MSVIQKVISTALGFVREHTEESSTRLVMLMFGGTACIIGLGALVFAFKHPDGVSMVVALGGVATLFIGSGAIAIALRTRKGGEPADVGPTP